MKHTYRVPLLLLLLVVPQVYGAITDGSVIDITRPTTGTNAPGYGNNDRVYGGALMGGEFRVTALGNAAPEVFKTFCLEYNENVTLGGDYVATLEAGAILGGTDSGLPLNDGIDYLSNATQWFYHQYRTNQLSGFGDFHYDDGPWADALQLMFWRLEEEVGPGWTVGGEELGNDYVRGLADQLWNAYQNNRDTIDKYADSHVQVINLWTLNIADNGGPLGPNTNNYGKLDTDSAFRLSLTPYKAQSQLYYDGAAVVPEPSALAIWAAGLTLGSIWCARRRRITSRSS